MSDGIMVRSYTHKTIEDIAKYADVPVINGLSDLEHPCQILADIMTIVEVNDKHFAEVAKIFLRTSQARSIHPSSGGVHGARDTSGSAQKPWLPAKLSLFLLFLKWGGLLEQESQLR